MIKYWWFFIYRLRVSISGEKNKINIYMLKVYKNMIWNIVKFVYFVKF